MPDTPDPQAPPAEPQPTATASFDPKAPEAFVPVDKLGEAGKAALQKERADRKAAEKLAAELEARLKAIEDKDKTELERAQTRLAELEKNYATEQQQRLRLQVATAHGITSDDLVLMTGTTEEELTAQATRIAALNAQRAAATAPPAFAPAHGHQAGNGTPPAPAATVDAGRQLYLQKHAKSA